MRSSMVASRWSLARPLRPLLPVGLLALEEERESVLEGEFGDVGHAELLVEGLGHPAQAEFVEEFESGLSDHGGQSSLSLEWLA